MPAPDIARRALWLPTDKRVTVDWSHPLAAGLVFFTCPNQIRGAAYFDREVLPATVPTPYGPAWSMAADTVRIFAPGLSATADYTVASVAMLSSGTISMLTCDTDSGVTPNSWPTNGGRAWQFRLTSNSVNVITFNASNGVVNGASTAGNVTPGVVAVAVAAMSGTDKTVAGNVKTTGSRGLITGASTSATAWNTTALGKMAIGKHAAGDDGWVLCSFLWARSLPVSERIQFYADPFQMLRW